MASVDVEDWVIVCGGFHHRGGMDRANSALAEHLVATGEAVHLIAHDVDSAWLERPRATVSPVPRVAGSYVLGELALERRGRAVVRALLRSGRTPRVVANGGNMAGADVNWVHSVHQAWPCSDGGAPPWFRLKNHATKAWARVRERRAIRSAPLVVTNSRRTTADLVTRLGVDERRVYTVYLGSDPTWVPASAAIRSAARQRWCAGAAGGPLIAFVGALGHDTNKGIDILLDAWGRLRLAGWNASLVVAGPGRTDRWQRVADRCGNSIRFVGAIDDVGSLLDGADLLVSPVRYEAYGLAAHEAVCRGVPVIITASAGLVERLPADITGLLLPDPPTAESLVARLQEWSAAAELWRRRFESASQSLRSHRSGDMARQIVNLVKSTS